MQKKKKAPWFQTLQQRPTRASAQLCQLSTASRTEVFFSRTSPALCAHRYAQRAIAVFGNPKEMVPWFQTLRQRPFTLHPTPCTLHPTRCALHPTPYTLRPTPYTLNPTPYTLHPEKAQDLSFRASSSPSWQLPSHPSRQLLPIPLGSGFMV